MKAFSIASAASAALLSSTPAAGQQDSSVFGARSVPRPPESIFSWDRGHGRHRGFHSYPGFILVEREVPVIVEREVVVAPPPKAISGTPNRDVPEKARKPYVVGASYASLPGGCMKLVEQGASYYFCGGGEWYRQVGEGRSVSYRAVSRKL